MKIFVCIPARYQSTRLPGKPLLTINGKSIIRHVYDKCLQLHNYFEIQDIVVLTDDDRIENEVNNFNGKSVMITDECINGTDRIIHYINKHLKFKYNINDDVIIVNVQGDEPFINPINIKKAIDNFLDKRQDQNMVCSTLHHTTQDKDIISLKSRGKAVLDNNNNIMYCSRNPIPSNKNEVIISNYDYNIHIGVFVFRASYLRDHYFNNNTKLQLTEDIEWMKIMEQGFKINSVQVDEQERGVDTMDDYTYLLNKYTNT